MRKEIIKSWNDINLNQYIELREIATEEGIDESERNLQILSILLDCTVEELENMPLLKLKTYSGALGFLQSPPQPGKTRRTYKLRGTEYKVFKDFNGITTSQFIDFQTYAKDPDKNIKELLGVILIPSGHNYNEGYDLSDTIELIGETLNVPDALSLLSFFLKKFVKSTVDSLQSSLAMTRKLVKKLEKTNPEKVEEIKKKLEILDSTGLL